jgi:hypothetical protein
VQASSAAALEAFWCEQGLAHSEAQQLIREVQADPQLAASCCNTQVNLSQAPVWFNTGTRVCN